MSDNYIKLPKTGEIKDEFAQKQDRKKAYQIFFISFLSSLILTGLMYAITLI